MKYRMIIFMVVCTALLIAGCGNKEPLAPDPKELALNEQDILLAKKPGDKLTPWEGIETTCEIIPGEEWYEGTIWHGKDWVAIDHIESDDPKIAGINTVTYSFSLDLATGEGTASDCKWSVKPYAFKGTWEGRSIAYFSNYAMIYHGVGIGTRDLKGMMLTVEGLPCEIKDPPCETASYQHADTGYIIEKK